MTTHLAPRPMEHLPSGQAAAHLSVREHDTLVRGHVSKTGEGNVHTLASQDFEALQNLISRQAAIKAGGPESSGHPDALWA